MRDMQYELVVVGGGMAGIAAAVAAARRGLRTALVHAHPSLGGSAGKDAGLPLQGAEGGYNRYSRETGLVEELRLENLRRNPLGNRELWDALLLEVVHAEENLDLYLSTFVMGIEKSGPTLISVQGMDLSSGDRCTLQAPLFADCTGRGLLAALAGSDRLPSDDPEEAAPPPARLLFRVRDAGRPVPFTAPRGAVRPTGGDRYGRLAPDIPQVWWVEAGSERVTDSELRFLAYGAFDHLKNSAEYGAANANLELDWVATQPVRAGGPGAAGDYILTLRDLLEQTAFEDAVAVAGSTSGVPYLRGRYSIPFRSLCPLDPDNLLLAGGSISATQPALQNAAIPGTAAQTGEAVGAAAFHCRLRNCSPRELLENGGIYALQQDLLKADHPIPGVPNDDPADLARLARVTESSLADAALERPDGEEASLDRPRALMLPLAGKLEHISLLLRSPSATRLSYSLHAPDARDNYLPGPQIAEAGVDVPASAEATWLDLPVPLDDAEPGFYWLLLEPAPGVSLAATQERLVGVLSFVQEGAEPEWRRVEADYCFRTDSWIPAFYAGEQVINRVSRPCRTPNIWVSAPTDWTLPEWLEFAWEAPVEVGALYLYFNTDLDRELRNVWTEYAFRAIPEAVRDYRLFAYLEGTWRLVFEERDNYQRFRVHHFPAVLTQKLRLEMTRANGDNRAQLYEVRIYGPEG